MKIKVCGLKYAENMGSVSKLDIDFMGFIFYEKSLRFSKKWNENLFKNFHKKRVGVFVNKAINEVVCLQKRYSLDYLQLHGNESVKYCKELSKHTKIIKAFQVDERFDFNASKEYEEVVSYFLFDTKSKNYGGSGKKFNWKILSHYQLSTPFFLSGGIAKEDAPEIKNLSFEKMIGVDINSQFEIAPGLKDIEKLQQFILKLKS